MNVAEVVGVLVIVAAMWAIFVGSGWYMSKAMGRNPIEGAALALLFGPLGLLLAGIIGLVAALKAEPEKPPAGEVSVRIARPRGTNIQK